MSKPGDVYVEELKRQRDQLAEGVRSRTEEIDLLRSQLEDARDFHRTCIVAGLLSLGIFLIKSHNIPSVFYSSVLLALYLVSILVYLIGIRFYKAFKLLELFL